MRTFLGYLVGFILSLAIVEILLGYRGYREANRHRLVMANIFQQVLPATRQVVTHHSLELPQHYTYFEERDMNPFLQNAGSVGMHKYHPLLDFTGVYSNVKKVKWDTFGYRNDEDLYFDSPESRDYELIILTGGSESAGYSHKFPIAVHLQNALNEKGGRFKVLNLSMCGYTLSNEIQSFVQLGYRLKPRAVVSLSGYNDMISGLMVPRKFKEIGFIYFRHLEHWMPRLYELRETEEDTVSAWAIDEKGKESLVGSYLANVEKYREVVRASGATFLSFIQGYETGFRPKDDKDKVYVRVHALMQELDSKAKKQGSVILQDELDLKFVDSAHTTEETAGRVGRYLAGQVQRRKVAETQIR